MTIYPTQGNPNVYATSTDGWMIGEPGYNYIGYPGGSNAVSYQLSTSYLVASLANPAINTGDATGDTYNDIQTLAGSQAGSTLYGSNLYPFEQLIAEGGTNYLYGGSGYTTFVAGPGSDFMFAGVGGGLADYELAPSGVTVDLGDPSINTGWAAGDTYSNVHNIAGSAYNDVLVADNSNDNILGNDGDNVLIGGYGDDTLNGGPGANFLEGGAGPTWFVFGGSAIGAGDVSMDPLSVLYNAETGTYSEIANFIAGNDRVDVAPLIDSLGDGGVSVSSLVRVVEDTGGSFASFQFDGPSGWVDLARIDGQQAGDIVGVITSDSNSTGTLLTVEATPLTDTTNTAEWLLSNGEWSSSINLGSNPGPDWQVAATGDLTGNGTSDILWYNVNTGDVAEWQLLNGAWSNSVDFGNPGLGWQVEGTGNFFGNGTSDVVLYNAGEHQVDIWELSNGQWVGNASVGILPGVGWQVAAIGDFTGNGTSDVLWHNVGSGDVAEWQLSGAGQWAATVDFGTAPAGMQIEGAGYFFGGNAPAGVLWFNPSTGETDIWQMANGHWAGSISVGTIPGGYQVAGIGDFTGNGTSDILWYNPNTRDVAEWLIHNGHWAGSVDLGTLPTGLQIAGVGDFTHNGTSDVLLIQHTLA